MLSIAARAAAKPPSRNTAPKIASSASAMIDARSAPPLFSSPSPSRMCAPRSIRRAICASVSRLTRFARARDNSPSCVVGKRSNSIAAIAQFKTASPTNSSRSLCGMPKLRCVSASRSNPGSRNSWPSRARKPSAIERDSTRSGRVEVQQNTRVGNHGQHALPRNRRRDLIVLPRHLYVVGLNRFNVTGARFAVEVTSDFSDIAGWRILERLLQRLLHGEVFDVGRRHSKSDERDSNDNHGDEQESKNRYAALVSHHEPLPSSAAHRMPLPTRLNARDAMSSQLNQMKNARPRMWSSGTKPQYRLSSLLSRLSPIIRYWPCGTRHLKPRSL